MTKRLQQMGNSLGLILDKPILSLLNITAETELEISTDGQGIHLKPVRLALTTEMRAKKLAEAHEWVLKTHAETFRKLAK